MRKAAILFTITYFMLCWSCGGGSDSEKVSEKPKAKKKTYSLKTEDGMMNKLQDMGIKIPLELKFVEINRKSGEYSAKFVADSVDESTKSKLDEWYQSVILNKEQSGWSKRAIRVDEEMMGSVYNQYILLKPRESGVGFYGGMDITSVHNPDKKTFTLYVQPD